MKYLTTLASILAVALCQTSLGAEKTTSTKAKDGGSRVQEKAVMARQMRGLLQAAKTGSPVLLLRVETRMENGKQKIVATATAHSDTQTGPLIAVDALHVRVTQPAQFRKDGRRTNTTIDQFHRIRGCPEGGGSGCVHGRARIRGYQSRSESSGRRIKLFVRLR